MTNDFEQLGVASCFIGRLEERSIIKATDIQRKIIPRLAEGESIFFSSATGTGKTFAYLLPLLSRLLIEKTDLSLPRLLIIAPTLELCSQISAELDFLLKGSTLQSALLIGSVNIERQIENLRKTKPDIIVGNPNRLLVLAKKRIIKFKNLQSLVLDEADRLVSDEMTDDTGELCKIIRGEGLILRPSGAVKKVLNPSPIPLENNIPRCSAAGLLILQETKNTEKKLIVTACSATMNKKSREKLFTVFCSTVPFVESEDNEILREKIEHWAIFSEKRRKDQTLRSLLSAIKTGKKGKASKKKIKALVFTSRGDEASLILSRLQYHHVPSAGLFGKAGKKALSSADRKAALEAFRQGGIEALISTDLAARGLDIPGITHVIALDVPSDSEVYIHRCGRTGRAGKYGIMVTIGDETQMRLLSSLEKKLKIRIQPKELYYGKVCDPLPDED